MTNCKLCQKKIKEMSMTCSMGTICNNCSQEISMAMIQPTQSIMTTLWTLAETFFRKAKGEQIILMER